MKNTGTSLYAFTLGREWKLSLAELFALWGEEAYQIHTEEVAIFQIVGYSDEQLAKKFLTLGGSIRMIRILAETTPATFPTDVIDMIVGKKAENSKSGVRGEGTVGTKMIAIGSDEQSEEEGVGLPLETFGTFGYKSTENGVGKKITFALGTYGFEYRLSDIGLRIKKTLTERGLSVRLANTENKNINAASFKKAHLGKSGMEYSIISINSMIYLGKTLACQDIDAYANRDTAKTRDMVVGMMPPKLVQMMINIAGSLDNRIVGLQSNGGQPTNLPTYQPTIYDPFCGLGTTLIEAANMGILEVSGSDLSTDMVGASKQGLEEFIKTELVWQERIRAVGGTPAKDFSKLTTQVFHLDAREVKTAFTRYNVKKDTTIISEGYLGEVMNPRDITLDRVQSERRKLANMYDAFFAGLSTAKYTGTIVMSFPFWNIHGTYSYFSEIYDIIERNGFRTDSLLPGYMGLNTRQGSLLYRRENQTVGREIVKIKRSN